MEREDAQLLQQRVCRAVRDFESWMTATAESIFLTVFAIAIASSTSIPRYLPVLAHFVCPSRSCAARWFFVRLQISATFLRRIVDVAQESLFRTISRILPRTIRACCRIEKYLAVAPNIQQGRLQNCESAALIQARTASRLTSVISNWHGLRVFRFRELLACHAARV